MTIQLDTVVRQLLDGRRGEWKEIAHGSGVSYSWLSKFANGHIDNPGYGTLMKLHGYLIKTSGRRWAPVAKVAGDSPSAAEKVA